MGDWGTGVRHKSVPMGSRKKRDYKKRRDVHKAKWTPKTLDDDLISVKEACWHNHYGECHFLACDITHCPVVCPNWTCFEEGYLKMLKLKKPKKFPPMSFHDLWLQNDYIRTIYQVMGEGQGQVQLRDQYVQKED